jgi:hypothetical protein
MYTFTATRTRDSAIVSSIRNQLNPSGKAIRDVLRANNIYFLSDKMGNLALCRSINWHSNNLLILLTSVGQRECNVLIFSATVYV